MPQMITRKILVDRTPLPDHTLSRVLRRHISSHLYLLRTNPVAPNLGLDTQKMVHDGFHPMPLMFVLHGAEGLMLNPAEDEHSRIPWLMLSPRRSHPCPTNRSATANVLMAFLHCSVLALNNWIGWRYSLNSQSYCGCHPVFIFLNSSLIKSPTVGLGKINQHFRIYSCFHAVLSITSNIYFIVLLFSSTSSL